MIVAERDGKTLPFEAAESVNLPRFELLFVDGVALVIIPLALALIFRCLRL